MTADMFTIPAAARIEWPSTRARRLLWAEDMDTPLYDAVAAEFGRVGAAS
jgi:hypothetical protein